MAELRETPLPLHPFVFTLTSVVVPLTRSRTKTSLALFVSFATRLLAALSKSTYWPLVEMPTGRESPLPPPVPARLMLTRVVVLLAQSRRYTFRPGMVRTGIGAPLPITIRLFAVLAKST